MRHIIQSLFLLPVIFLSIGCSEEEPDNGLGLAGTYVGQMNVGSTSYQNVSYTVTVTETGASSVQITPSTNDASQWTSSLMNLAGVYTCVNCTEHQITFTPLNGNMQLSYNYNSDEQYTGTKQ